MKRSAVQVSILPKDVILDEALGNARYWTQDTYQILKAEGQYFLSFCVTKKISVAVAALLGQILSIRNFVWEYKYTYQIVSEEVCL